MEAADDEDLELIREAQGVRCVAEACHGRGSTLISWGFSLEELSPVLLCPQNDE